MSELAEIPERQCLELVRGEAVGRVRFVTASGPREVPVTYTVVGEEIQIRTSEFSELAANAPDSDVTFEVDRFDHARRSGWEVLLRGRCRRLAEADESWPEPDVRGPWAGLEHTAVLGVCVHEIEGWRTHRSRPA